ncbi:hypothetical protein A2960_01285 [Candidatus Gottesmanbacteria bacterium RIFCSPLOWO2_01_FULL_39_12b]|uniref:Glycosyltransferase 2-like domain-containing protein n=1 Tax=Candidatus Gottesmanbacteria bacterium RIFCSPLOWO2_01_FULL_39_12b TaxID=1798388 RepID=A0A1F6AQ20_9BACT|nr:MAG: hypothetical protein A2960_01285 [Candidatus Gottesmanbacteria bacterium RIFCSPLOWO2_01_FULL_39_12b]
MKKIFLVILNFNGKEDTVKCLKTIHLLEDKSYYLNTLIVDNGSRTDEITGLKSFLNDPVNKKNFHFKNILLIENQKNLGFAAGNNVGIRYALNHEAEYVLLLNNDTKVEMNFLKNLVILDLPLSSPIVKFREFKDKPKLIFDLGGYVNWWTGRTYHLNAYLDEIKRFKSDKYLEVDYVAGCCMLVKKEVFERIGLLDQKYFIYFEDVDFCVTAKKYGYKVAVDPKGEIYHKLGGSMDRWSNRAIFHNLLGNFIFITKHMGLRRITGYTYLLLLTLKIIRDRIGDKANHDWKGAPHNFHE